jgi:hypothetical protein
MASYVVTTYSVLYPPPQNKLTWEWATNLVGRGYWKLFNMDPEVVSGAKYFSLSLVPFWNIKINDK